MVESDPPIGDFGPSPLTKALRPNCLLDENQKIEARRMRKNGAKTNEIAEYFHVEERYIEIALSTLRTPQKRATRKALNVGVKAHNIVFAEKQSGEAVWQTVDRILTVYEASKKAKGAP